MNKVKTIHHAKALSVALHIIKTKRHTSTKELTPLELIEIEVALKMVIDDLTTDAVQN